MIYTFKIFGGYNVNVAIQPSCTRYSTSRYSCKSRVSGYSAGVQQQLGNALASSFLPSNFEATPSEGPSKGREQSSALVSFGGDAHGSCARRSRSIGKCILHRPPGGVAGVWARGRQELEARQRSGGDRGFQGAQSVVSQHGVVAES